VKHVEKPGTNMEKAISCSDFTNDSFLVEDPFPDLSSGFLGFNNADENHFGSESMLNASGDEGFAIRINQLYQ